MKKIKIIVAAILRGVVILAPGATFLWWAWGKVSALFAILASIGVETIYLFLFALVICAIRAAKDMKEKKEEKATD